MNKPALPNLLHCMNVYLYVFDTCVDWESAYAIDGLAMDQFQPEKSRFTVRTVGDNLSSVRSAGGLKIKPDVTFGDIEDGEIAMLIMPGSDRWVAGELDAAAYFAELLLDKDIPVAAICGATYGLARAGILDHRQHTSNAREYIAKSGYQGGELYVDAPAVTDGKLITSPATAPLEFARAIFKMLGAYDEATLENWYQLYKTGDAKYFHKLAASMA